MAEKKKPTHKERVEEGLKEVSKQRQKTQKTQRGKKAPHKRKPSENDEV